MSVLRKKPFVEELLESLTADEIARLASIIDVKGEPEVVDLGLTGKNPLPSSAPASIEDRIKLINLVLSPSSVYTGILIYHSTSYCALIGTVAYENDIIKLFKLNVASRKAEPINEKLTADELRRVLLQKATDNAIKTIRDGQYVEVDTEEYPTLEDFLDSDGEQGTVYLYPVGNQANNYYQYIWETGDWISLGTTDLDLSGYIKGEYLTQAEYDALTTKDPNKYYFIPEGE